MSRTTRLLQALLLASPALWLQIAAAGAADYIWTNGSGSRGWTQRNNWSPNSAYPQLTIDRAIFNSAFDYVNLGSGAINLGQIFFTSSASSSGDGIGTDIQFNRFNLYGVGGVGLRHSGVGRIIGPRNAHLMNDLEYRLDNPAGNELWLFLGGRLQLVDKTLTVNAVFENNIFRINGASGGIGGTGNLILKGQGKIISPDRNSYTGETDIQSGSFILGNIGAVATSSRINIDAPGKLDVSSVRLPTVQIQTLSGAGAVVLGDNILELTNARTAFSGVISGTGGVLVSSGAMVLSGANTYTGHTSVASGARLHVNGDQSAAVGQTLAVAGAALGGEGVIGGDVQLDGSLEPGADGSVGVLTVNGALSLSASASLDMQLGAANSVGSVLNDRVDVGRDLTLDGVLNITVPTGGDFAPGLYRLINYGGALTDNGLAIGTAPAAATGFYIQTSVPGQVNLINTTGLTFNFWDGDAGIRNDVVISGGDGVWRASASGLDNWTGQNGAINAPFSDGSFAVFMGAGGAVTVSQANGPVVVSGIQFVTDGYVLDGDPIHLSGDTATVRIGDGTGAGAIMTARLNNVLTGPAQLHKADAGALVLTAENTYSGGTHIDGGVLAISRDANLGAASGPISFGGGTLAVTGSFFSARPVQLAGSGAIDVASDTTLALGGAISGPGGLVKRGDGALVLTADNSYQGGTTIEAGALSLGDGGVTGAIVGDVFNEGELVFNRADRLNVDSPISGAGQIRQAGVGITTLGGDSGNFSGRTTIERGALVVNGALGGALDVLTGARLEGVGRVGETRVSGVISPGGGVLACSRLRGSPSTPARSMRLILTLAASPIASMRQRRRQSTAAMSTCAPAPAPISLA